MPVVEVIIVSVTEIQSTDLHFLNFTIVNILAPRINIVLAKSFIKAELVVIGTVENECYEYKNNKYNFFIFYITCIFLYSKVLKTSKLQ